MPHQQGIKTIALNRKAWHDYFIEEKYECGIALFGTEVKSIRQGKVNLKEAVKRAATGKHGLTFIISDFYDEAFLDAEEELCKFMRYLRQEPVLLQVLSHEELEIDDTGAARLHDIEIPEEMVSATFDRITVDGYLEALNEFTTRLKLSADTAGAGYYLCRTDRTIGRILLEDLRGLYDI